MFSKFIVLFSNKYTIKALTGEAQIFMNGILEWE